MSKTSAIIDDFSKGEVTPLALAKLASAEVRDGLEYCENLIPDPRGPIIPRQGLQHIDEFDCTDKHISLYNFEMYEGKSIVLVLHDDKLTLYNGSDGNFMQQLSSPYTATLLHGENSDRHNVTVYVAPDAEDIYFLHASVTPWILTIADLSPAQDDLVDATFAAESFTAKPSEWTGDNYPTTCTFFQDRVWFAGCKLNPETIWASKSETFDDMTLGANDNDALKFVLQQHGLIKWMAGHKNLLIGTAFGEYIATSSGGVITPSDIHIDIQSAYGSKSIQPEFIGDEVLYVSPDGRKLRSMWYKWLEAGWKSIDLTFLGDHLTKGTIKDIAYVRDPYSSIYILTGTNQILSCSYLRSNDISTIGFARVTPATELTKVVAMTTLQNEGTSSLWIGAQTEVDGVTKVHLMKQDTKDIYSEELVMLDNYTESTPVTNLLQEGFFEDNDEWTQTNTSMSLSGGVCTLTNSTSAAGFISQTISVEASGSYAIRCDTKAGTGNARVYVKEGTTDITDSTALSGATFSTFTDTFTPSGSTVTIKLETDSTTASADCYFKNVIVYDTDGGEGDIVFDLDYLEGQTVDLTGDDAVLPTIEIVDGIVQLDNSYSVVRTGHSYSQKMITLPFIIYGQSQLGHQKKHWNKIFVSLLNSFPPLINGKRPPARSVVTPMGDGEPSFTGLTNITNVGWDREGKITIEQDIPRALMILGIYGEVALEDV